MGEKKLVQHIGWCIRGPSCAIPGTTRWKRSDAIQQWLEQQSPKWVPTWRHARRRGYSVVKVYEEVPRG